MLDKNAYLREMGVDIWVPRDGLVPGHDAAAGTPLDDEQDAWAILEKKVSACVKCELHRTRKNTVFGCGNIDAEWMLVGEAPGADEDRQGQPFVGRAGQLLNAMLAAIKLEREQVYITNVLKCRPPNNRDPQGVEVRECEGYLHQQIERIRPKIILALGRFAVQSLLKTTRPIGKLRGEVHRYGSAGTPLIATYHPAYLLRNPLDKRKAWADLCLAQRVLRQA